MDRSHRSIQPLCFQGGTYNGELPVRYKFIICMLQLASAAGFEMSTGWLHPMRRGRFDAQIRQLVAVDKAADLFARKRTRDKKRAIRDPVSLMPETIYCCACSHGPGDSLGGPKEKTPIPRPASACRSARYLHG